MIQMVQKYSELKKEYYNNEHNKTGNVCNLFSMHNYVNITAETQGPARGQDIELETLSGKINCPSERDW